MTKKIAIYGAGGLGKEIYFLIKELNAHSKKWDFVGFFDDFLTPGSEICNSPILGNIDALNKWESDLDIAIAIGNPKVLAKIISEIKNSKISFPNLIAPNVDSIAKDSLSMGYGNIIREQTFLSCFLKIGNFNLFNGQVAVGHNTTIGDCNVFMPGTKISGEMIIGNKNLFGINSAVYQGIEIGDEITLGACSFLVSTPKNGKTYLGNPAIIFNFKK